MFLVGRLSKGVSSVLDASLSYCLRCEATHSAVNKWITTVLFLFNKWKVPSDMGVLAASNSFGSVFEVRAVATVKSVCRF